MMMNRPERRTPRNQKDKSENSEWKCLLFLLSIRLNYTIVCYLNKYTCDVASVIGTDNIQRKGIHIMSSQIKVLR